MSGSEANFIGLRVSITLKTPGYLVTGTVKNLDTAKHVLSLENGMLSLRIPFP